MPNTSMTQWVEMFSALDLIGQDLLLDELTSLHNAAKERRRQELRTELGLLTDRPMKAKAKPTAKAKYRSLKNPALTWGGRGAKAAWLEAEMKESGKPLEAFKVG
jgi:DNA-binding protein H-NS